MDKDRTGNHKSVYTTLGASNHSDKEREKNDYYATEPRAVDALIAEGRPEMSNKLWECACGEGHLSKRLKEYGYDVYSTDLHDRGYGDGQVDFLKYTGTWDGDIITNPPYKYALRFVEHALETVTEGHKVFMFLKLQFLEGKARRKLFDTGCLKTVYVSSSRLQCAMNGDFKKYSKGTGTAIAYAWYEFERGYHGSTQIKWIN